jgi:hypothetical protein
MTIRDNYWTNDDGLTIGFGTNKSATGVASKIGVSGFEGELAIEIIGTEVPAAGAISGGLASFGATLPVGSVITGTSMIISEAFTSGGSATLNVGAYGLKSSDNTLVNGDIDGIVDGFAKGSLTVGEVAPTAGAQVNTAVASADGNSLVLVASYETAAFTAGKGTLIVKYAQL